MEADRLEREVQATEKVARDLASDADKKAARDARYAARKAKKRKGR